MNKLDTAALYAELPVEVIDLIGRERIQALVDFNPEAISIIFPALECWHRERGMQWFRDNAEMLRHQLDEVEGAQ